MAETSTTSKSGSPVETNANDKSSDLAKRRPKAALWLVGALGVVAVGLLFSVRAQKAQSIYPSTAVGPVVVGALTLQTADRNELDCMAEKGLKEFYCGAIDEHQTRQVGEGVKLRPFMTTDRQLYLVPGLFLEPAIAQRYNTEPANQPREQLKRFTAKCNITTIGELDNVKLRWSPTGPWEPPKKFPVATVAGCTIEG